MEGVLVGEVLVCDFGEADAVVGDHCRFLGVGQHHLTHSHLLLPQLENVALTDRIALGKYGSTLLGKLRTTSQTGFCTSSCFSR